MRNNIIKTKKESEIIERKPGVFGKELIMDLYDCDLDIISSKEKIQEYSEKLCDLIEVKRYGEPFIERFGLNKDFTAGYSLAQMIETSLVSGHFSEHWHSCYINIFSCKDFDEEKAITFTKEFFKAKSFKKRVLVR